MKKFNIADWQKKHLLNESRLNEVDSETTVKYTDDNGKDHEIKYGSAMKYDDKHPAKVAALSMSDDDSGSDKEAGQEKEPTGKLSGTDFERGSSDDSKSKPEFDKGAKRAAIKSSKEVAKTLEKTKDLKATIDQSAKSLESLSNNSYEAKDASKIMDTVLGMAKNDPIIFTEPEVSMKAVKTVFDKFIEEHGEDGEKELVRGIMSSHKRSPFLYALDDDMFKKYPKLETRKKNANDMTDYMNMNGMASIAYHADFENPKDPIIQHYGDKENLRTSAGTHTNKWDSLAGKGNSLFRGEEDSKDSNNSGSEISHSDVKDANNYIDDFVAAAEKFNYSGDEDDEMNMREPLRSLFDSLDFIEDGDELSSGDKKALANIAKTIEDNYSGLENDETGQRELARIKGMVGDSKSGSNKSKTDFTKKNKLSIKLDAETKQKYDKALDDNYEEWKAADGDQDLQDKIDRRGERIQAKVNQEKRDNLYKAFGDDLEGFENQPSFWLKNLSKHYGGSVAKKLKPIIKDKIAQEKAEEKASRKNESKKPKTDFTTMFETFSKKNK